jgi:predicted amidohydrolase
MRRVTLALAQLASGPDRAENLARCLEAMEAAHRAGAGLVAFPEVVLDRFFPSRPCGPGDCRALDLAEPIPGPATERVAEAAARLGLVAVFNLYEIDNDLATGGRRFDSSPVFDADGRLLGVTRMLHITDYEGFHEQSYYAPGDCPDERGLPVYETRVGRVGVAICYDRHYPEAMRALGLGGAELVVIPQAGAAGEWPEGMYEAEVRTAAFQNGYFVALCNRVGQEETLTFAGESFVVDPEGRIAARARGDGEELLLCEIDLDLCERSTARRLFWRHRRPELYGAWFAAPPRSS